MYLIFVFSYFGKTLKEKGEKTENRKCKAYNFELGTRENNSEWMDGIFGCTQIAG